MFVRCSLCMYACLVAYYMNTCSPQTACMPSNHRTYPGVQTRSECNERNLEKSGSTRREQQYKNALPTWIKRSDLVPCQHLNSFTIYEMPIAMERNRSGDVYTGRQQLTCSTKFNYSRSFRARTNSPLKNIKRIPFTISNWMYTIPHVKLNVYYTPYHTGCILLYHKLKWTRAVSYRGYLDHTLIKRWRRQPE